MRDLQIDCLIGPQKANIVRQFLPVFRRSRGLSRSPDLDGFLRLALRRAKADGYAAEDLVAFAETGELQRLEVSDPQIGTNGHAMAD